VSFFDDGEEETAVRTASRGAGGTRPRPRPRRPQNTGPGLDQHTLMMRRRIVAGVAVVVVIIIVLAVNGCLKSQKTQSLKDYDHNVAQIASESDSQVSKPLFAALSGAGSKSALDVEVQIDQLRIAAQTVASKAKHLAVPGEMAAAQRALLMAVDFRVEGMTKLAALVPTALGAKSKQASTLLAGDMEIFLASDVIFSQRVVPLVSQTLASNGIKGLSLPSSRFLPNIGWLDPNTTFARITGQASSSQSSQAVTGNHGSALKGVSVGTNILAPEPTLNHITGGGNPTFTVQVENSGEFPETNVKVDITVTAGGKQYKASHAIEKTEPGKTVNVEIPVTGIPLGVAAKVQVSIEGVPGENDLENNKGTFLAIFGA
jgi:hypothetical protein